MKFKKKELLVCLLELLAINCFTVFGVCKAVGWTKISVISLVIMCLMICIIMLIKKNKG